MPVSISGTNGVTFPDSSLQAAAASPYVLKNRLINGDFRISQRGATISGINADFTYTADRWLITRGGSVNYTQGTTNPPTGFQYYGSYINQTASNPFVTIQQVIESTNTYDLLGQTVTLSAWIKAAANTAASTSVIVTYGYATTADTRYTTLVSGTTFAISSSAWTKCSITFTVPSNALTIVPVIYNSATLAVGDGYLITGVQLEQNTSATPFERRLYGQELANCQRYCRTISNDGGTDKAMFSGVAYLNNTIIASYTFPTMRVAPTATITNATSLDVVVGNNVVAGGTLAIAEFTLNSLQPAITNSGTPYTVGHGAVIRSDGLNIVLSAEL
jgi:hypothetical protein